MWGLTCFCHCTRKEFTQQWDPTLWSLSKSASVNDKSFRAFLILILRNYNDGVRKLLLRIIALWINVDLIQGSGKKQIVDAKLKQDH